MDKLSKFLNWLIQVIRRFVSWWWNTFRKQGTIGKLIFAIVSLSIVCFVCSSPSAILSPSEIPTPQPVSEANPTETSTLADTPAVDNTFASIPEPTATPKPTNIPAPTNTPTSMPQPTPIPTILLPEYTLFKDASYEDAGTVKVIWEILVSPDITKDPLNALLNELYKEALAKTPGNNDRPVVIDIKAYTSKEHATSGMGQWIGWVSKIGSDTEPSLRFNESQLDAKNETLEIKFGLSEAERIQTWQAIIKTEDRAEEEALQQYPNMQPFAEFEKLEKELVLKYKSELAQEKGLSLEQLDEIADEGLIRNWPLPP